MRKKEIIVRGGVWRNKGRRKRKRKKGKRNRKRKKRRRKRKRKKGRRKRKKGRIKRKRKRGKSEDDENVIRSGVQKRNRGGGEMITKRDKIIRRSRGRIGRQGRGGGKGR